MKQQNLVFRKLLYAFVKLFVKYLKNRRIQSFTCVDVRKKTRNWKSAFITEGTHRCGQTGSATTAAKTRRTLCIG